MFIYILDRETRQVVAKFPVATFEINVGATEAGTIERLSFTPAIEKTVEASFAEEGVRMMQQMGEYVERLDRRGEATTTGGRNAKYSMVMVFVDGEMMTHGILRHREHSDIEVIYLPDDFKMKLTAETFLRLVSTRKIAPERAKNYTKKIKIDDRWVAIPVMCTDGWNRWRPVLASPIKLEFDRPPTASGIIIEDAERPE